MNSGSGDSLKCSAWCGLSANARQNPADGGLVQPGGRRHGTGGPVSGVGRLLFERFDDHPLHVLVADLAGLTRPRLIVQAVQPVHNEPGTLLANRGHTQAQPARHGHVGRPSAQASTTRQRNASAWALLGRRAQRSSVARWSSLKITSGAFG
jgi:hypothetical protein